VSSHEYVFIDTETTGCRPITDRIIEVGLFHVIDGIIQSSWSQLINPQTYIPSSIQTLTGITNEMVAKAPPFADIAYELAELLHGKIFVAHNARFDYAFIKNEFKRCEINLQFKTLCTVKLSRLLFPKAHGHSLDAICNRFGLTTTNRHRALGDAELLVKFYSLLEQQFPHASLQELIHKTIKQPALPSAFTSLDIETIPLTAGVYYFYSEDNTLLYVGKSIKLRERILSHFAQDHASNKEMQLSQQARKINWTTTAGELGALLLESRAIKTQLPIFNRRLRRHKRLHTLLANTTKEGYLCLDIIPFEQVPAEKLTSTYGLFRYKRRAEELLFKLCNVHHFCQRMMGLEKRKGACFYVQIGKCSGACTGKESTTSYNQRLVTAISNIQYQRWPYHGKVALKEHCQLSGKCDYHLIDQWCYLGSASTLDGLLSLAIKPQLDADIYQILTSHLQHPNKKFTIIDLSQ
jgi:DNA polymerase-3 subunit epsilon